MPSIEGELVTETLEYDGGRQVTVYVPPDPPEAVVFAGDGQLIAQWGEVLEAADAPSTMIVGAHRLARRDAAVARVLAGTRPGTVRGPQAVLRRACQRMGEVTLWRRPAERTNRGLRRLGEWRAGARRRANGIQTSTALCSVPRRAVATGHPT